MDINLTDSLVEAAKTIMSKPLLSLLFLLFTSARAGTFECIGGESCVDQLLDCIEGEDCAVLCHSDTAACLGKTVNCM